MAAKKKVGAAEKVQKGASPKMSPGTKKAEKSVAVKSQPKVASKEAGKKTKPAGAKNTASKAPPVVVAKTAGAKGQSKKTEPAVKTTKTSKVETPLAKVAKGDAPFAKAAKATQAEKTLKQNIDKGVETRKGLNTKAVMGTTSSKKLDEKKALSDIVEKLNTKSAAKITDSASKESEPARREPKGPMMTMEKLLASKSERMKIERTLNDNSASGTKKWNTLHEQLRNIEVSDYLMSETYHPKMPIVHKVLGWGYVVDCRENRMDVLFKDGVKTLIMGHKA